MRLLQGMGYTRLRSYLGGIEDWKASGGSFESGSGRIKPQATARRGARRRPLVRMLGLLDRAAERGVGELLALWLGMVLLFGLVYWLENRLFGAGLVAGGTPVANGVDGLLTSVYFSFVTATSVGFGDVVPAGPMRAVAVIEAALGLLLFGFIVSKFVSRRQEAIVDEIHLIAFEDRLGRVQTNLHLVLSELQAVAGACRGGDAGSVRVRARIHSVVMVFAGELRTIHDLLYRPQLVPDEGVLELILAGLAAALSELRDLLAAAPAEERRTPAFAKLLDTVRTLAFEICGDCVPREYAAGLRESMDAVREIARAL